MNNETRIEQEPRPLVERAKDEIAAWFGNPDAAARRQRDEAVGDHSGQGPPSDLDEEARIVDEVSRKLTADPAIDASRIAVVAHDGVVVLSGQVLTIAHRLHAEELAHTVVGVSQVENRLVVE
jgi:osmotically-inducible protein OsmY